MARSFEMWKLKKNVEISHGMLCLLLDHDRGIEYLEGIDRERLAAEIERQVSDPVFQEHVTDWVVDKHRICFTTTFACPECVHEWFRGIAKREELVFIDEQELEISDPDCAAAERVIESARQKESKARLSGELTAIFTLADAGNPSALAELGNRYSLGEGVEVNLEKAFLLYTEAAKKGNPEGIFNLGSCYHHGHGVERNVSTAISHYEKALETDNVFAPFILGTVYRDGDGVTSDSQKAISYFRIALENGHSDARRELRKLGVSEF